MIFTLLTGIFAPSIHLDHHVFHYAKINLNVGDLISKSVFFTLPNCDNARRIHLCGSLGRR